MKHKYLTLTAIILILSSFLIASMLLGEGSEPMATLLDGHSQSHYTSDHALLAVHPSASLASAYGQAFTVKTIEETYKLTQTKFYLKRVGSPTGHLKACLYSMTGTYGTNAKPTGSPLASSELVDIATLGTSYSEIAFNFVGANQYEVSKDQKYCIEVQVNDGSLNSNNGVWCKASSGDQATHDGNESYYSASAWRSFSDKDFCFLVYGEYVAPPPPPTYYLTVGHDEKGDTTPPAGAYPIDEGTLVTLTYTPTGEYIFDKWLRNSTEIAQNPYSFFMPPSNLTVTGYGKTTFEPPPNEDWFSPTGFEDPDSKWKDEKKAYDDDISKYAEYVSPYTTGWNSFLILTVDNPITSDKIRFNAYNRVTIDAIDIDVYIPATDTWLDVYEGAFTSQVWIEKTFERSKISKVRIRFQLNTASGPTVVYEFDFWRIITPPLMGVRLSSNLALMLTGKDKGKVVILV